MSDPRRMIDLDGGGDDGNALTPLEGELLRAGRGERLSSGNKDRIWMGIAAQLLPPAAPSHPAGPGATGTAAVGAAKALTVATALKGAIVVAMLGGGSWAGYHATRSRTAGDVPSMKPATVSGPARVTAPIAMAQAEPDIDRPLVRRSAAPTARLSRDEAGARRPQPSRLAAEGRVVLEARRALREGDAAGALRRLEAARVEFADGALAQEREALTIEALYRDGQSEVASQRAAAFVRAYPGSPHAASVRNFSRR